MSLFNDKKLKGVAEAAAKIMGEQLKGNQHKIDANKNGRIDAHDFKLLRAKKGMKEDVVSEEDAYQKNRYAVQNGKATKDNPSHMGSANYKDQPHHVWATSSDEALKKKMKKEETELDEAFPSVEDAKKRMNAGKTATGTVTKTKTGLVHKRDYEHNAEDDDHPEKVGRPRSYGARQNYKRSTRVNESLSFTEMLELYNEHGLRVLAPIETEEIEVEGNTIEVIDADKINGYVETVVEEADTEEFKKDLDTNKKKAAGTAKQPDLAKGDTQAVKNEEVEQLDEVGDTPAGRKALSSYVQKALPDPSRTKGLRKATSRLYKDNYYGKKTNEETEQMDEVAPPGREKQVKALKKVPGITNPWAVSWASYRKSHPKKKD